MLPGPVWVVKSQIHAGGNEANLKLGEDAKGGVQVSFSREEARNIHEMFNKNIAIRPAQAACK